ncbi:ABC transporter substrate-binding protein [Oscillospiraceae bacterium HV4-5-C5C]|nr:ABC transporter substrate-binding protein [Oscillospiraceae bacterium HV4-5-C5C]
MKKSQVLWVSTCLTLALSGCAGTTATTTAATTATTAAATTTTGTTTAATTTTTTTTTAATAATAATTAAATTAATASASALSGKVTVYMPSPSGLADQLAAGFEAATGVQVETFQGTTGEILARLETEAANPVADVVILASWSDGLSLKEEGQLQSYTPAAASSIVDGWIDEDQQLFGYSASAVGVIYNTTIYPELSADWSELADAAYKDQLAIPDPEKSGACKDFIAGYVTNNGWSDLEALAANGMIVPGANKAALEAVTTGEVGILVAGVDYNAYSAIAKGEPLGIYYPAGGTVVNPRPAMIMKTAPDLANAQAFIDYLFSDEAQNMVAQAYLLPGRSDVDAQGRTSLADIPQLDCDWEKMMAEASEDAAELNELCQ